MKRILYFVAIALDFCVSMLIWPSIPMTVSSQCGLRLLAGDKYTPLARLGRALNWLSPGHTNAAIQADIKRCNEALKALNGN